ncbi:hypothetical protein OROHE_019126 [Orobanche hederae]
MKSIGICYSEQAIKVSNSHSRSDHHHRRNQAEVFFSSSDSNLSPARPDSTTNNYRVKLSTGKEFIIKLTWRRSTTKQGVSVSISEYSPIFIAGSTESAILLQRPRGIESLELRGSRIEVCWDFCLAGYVSGPEPVDGFYVVILVDSEPGLILGDVPRELEIGKRIPDTNSLEFKLISRCDLFSGADCYCSTTAKFCEGGKCHDILIELSGVDDDRRHGHGTMGTREPMLSVYVDKKSVVQVKRLVWNFRGNQTIFLDGLCVDLMWDLHDWFFGGGLLSSSSLSLSSSSSSGYGVFLFRTRIGLDSRLWLEKNIDQEDVGFSLLICAYSQQEGQPLLPQMTKNDEEPSRILQQV